MQKQLVFQRYELKFLLSEDQKRKADDLFSLLYATRSVWVDHDP